MPHSHTFYFCITYFLQVEMIEQKISQRCTLYIISFIVVTVNPETGFLASIGSGLSHYLNGPELVS